MKNYYDGDYAHIHGHTCSKEAKRHLKIKEKTYFGTLCKKCDTNLRHSRDRSCVLCSELSATQTTHGNVALKRCRDIASNLEGRPILTLHADRLVRKAATLAGVSVYVGIKCNKCGLLYRYTNRGTCMACVNERNKGYQTRRGIISVQKKTAPARTGAADFDYLFE